MKFRAALISLVIIGLAVLFYRHIFGWLYDEWTVGGLLNRDNPYGHGFLIPLISAFILWTRRAHFKEWHPSHFGIPVIAVGAVVYLIGFYVIDSRALVALSLPIVLGGAVLSFWGWHTLRAAVFPLFFLLFMIPPPFIQDLTYDLQQISYDSSRWFADLAGVATYEGGDQGDLVILIGDPVSPSAHLAIAPACSGINTLVALLALSALYAFILYGPFWKRALLFALVFPAAILGNALRIATIIMRADNRGQDSAMTLHDWSDPLFFLIALLVLGLIGMALGLSVSHRASNPPKPPLWLWGWLSVLVAVFIVASLFGIAGSALDAQGLPDAPTWAVGWLAVVAMSGVAACLGLFHWKKWGVYGLAIVGIMGMALTLAFGGGILAAIGWVIGVGVLYALLFIRRGERAWTRLR